jgi:tetratricopeptide (TPR) repeat protein
MLATAAPAQFGEHTAKVYGTVLGQDGQPVADARIILDPVEAEGVRVEAAAKGKKGSFFFGIVRPGVYVAKIEAGDMIILSMDAKAWMHTNKNKIEWDKNGNVNPDKPPHLDIKDGMDVSLDVVIGPRSQTAGGGGAGTSGADAAYAKILDRVRAGDCAATLPDLEKYAADNPSSARGLYLLGYCKAVTDDVDGAIDALTKAEADDPTFSGTEELLGRMYGRQKNYPEAEAAFHKEIDNVATPLEVQADAWLGLAQVLNDQGKTDDAIPAYKKVIELTPSRPEPYVELASLYSKAGKPDEAKTVIEQAKQAGASNPVAVLNVGVSYFNKKDYTNAEAMFRQVIDGGAPNDDLGMAYALLGRCQINQGKNADAIESLNKSLELDPNGRLADDTRSILKAMQKK